MRAIEKQKLNNSREMLNLCRKELMIAALMSNAILMKMDQEDISLIEDQLYKVQNSINEAMERLKLTIKWVLIK